MSEPLHIFVHAVWGLATHVFVFPNLIRGARSLLLQVAAWGFVFGVGVFCFPLALFHLWALRVMYIVSRQVSALTGLAGARG